VKFNILKLETLFQGFFRVDRYHVQHEKFDGSWSAPFTREVFNGSRQAVGVLLFDPQHDKVVLIEEFRAGIVPSNEDPWLIELPMGMVDVNESPEQAAQREALEESGCTVVDLQPIAQYFPSPANTSDKMILFAGRTTAPAEGGIFGLAKENEDICVHVLDAARAINLIYANKVRDAHTLIALQWFAMHHTELRSRWLVSDVGTPLI